MRKTLLTLFSGLVATTMASAQCTPDPALAGAGFGLYPDTIPFVQACVGCGAESRVVNFVTFTDTLFSVSGISATIYIDAFKIDSVAGVPAGLTYGTNVENDGSEGPFGSWFNNGDVPNQTSTQGCVYINGDEAAWNSAVGGGPNSDGIYPLEIFVDARMGGFNPDISFLPGISVGSWLSSVPENLGGGLIAIDEYFLDVRQGFVGITDLDPTKLGIADNFPNPFAGVTTIKYSAPTASNLTFNVYSILGNVVHTEQISAKQGLNNFDFDATGLNSGMYIYSLTDGASIATKKMTVK